MNATSIFKNLDEIIKIDHFNFQEIRYDFTTDSDYCPSTYEIIIDEMFDSEGNEVTLDKPIQITFEAYLKMSLSSELNRIIDQIEEESSKNASTDKNILFLICCLAKADTLVTRAEYVQNEYSNSVSEILRILAGQLHRRFDKEIEFKLSMYESDSEKSHSKILQELQRKIEIESTKEEGLNDGSKLKFNFNRNQLTVLFLLLKHNGGLTKDTKSADIANFLEKNFICRHDRTKELISVKNVSSLISEFERKENEKDPKAAVKYVKNFFEYAELKSRKS